jgi:hypothetical protein
MKKKRIKVAKEVKGKRQKNLKKESRIKKVKKKK